MTIDPKLLRELERRGDANKVLAEALGVCPTCGQRVNRGQKVPPPRAGSLPATRRPRGSVRAAIVDYLTSVDTEPGNQSRCAAHLRIAVQYVNKVWRAHQEKGGRSPTVRRGRPAERGPLMVQWLRNNPDKNQSDCARHFGVTRQAVSNALDSAAKRGDAPHGEADE